MVIFEVFKKYWSEAKKINMEKKMQRLSRDRRKLKEKAVALTKEFEEMK